MGHISVLVNYFAISIQCTLRNRTYGRGRHGPRKELLKAASWLYIVLILLLTWPVAASRATLSKGRGLRGVSNLNLTADSYLLRRAQLNELSSHSVGEGLEKGYRAWEAQAEGNSWPKQLAGRGQLGMKAAGNSWKQLTASNNMQQLEASSRQQQHNAAPQPGECCTHTHHPLHDSNTCGYGEALWIAPVL